MTTPSGRKTREDGDGWDAIVAIADVSFYVRPGSELDREARARGNSVYFPDRVVPMLPEELSADICSLKQGQARAAMACHLHVGKDGQLKSWRFTRAKICVAANIAYEDAQARDRSSPAGRAAGARWRGALGNPLHRPSAGPVLDPEIVEKALKPLWDCWQALLAARNKREPLELDIPERRVVLDEKGRILSVARARAARRAPAGRGLYDRRQCRRGPGAGGEEGAGHVPRPRGAGPRETGRAQGLSRHLRPRVRARAR